MNIIHQRYGFIKVVAAARIEPEAFHYEVFIRAE